MATSRQIEANRRNARASTGPRTERGKAAASMNALRHGLTTARDAVLPDEDREAYEALRGQIVAELKPEGAVQRQLAERVSLLFWRLARATRLETEMFTLWRLQHEQRALGRTISRGNVPVHLIESARAAGEAGKQVLEAFIEIEEKIDEHAPLAAGLDWDGGRVRSFDRLSRYETGLQRSLNRTIDQFWRLRRMAPPPGGAHRDGEKHVFLRNEPNSAQPLESALTPGVGADPGPGG